MASPPFVCVHLTMWRMHDGGRGGGADLATEAHHNPHEVMMVYRELKISQQFC